MAAAVLAASAASADNAPTPAAAFARYADPANVVLAVQAGRAPAGGAVRVSVYDDAAQFLEQAAVKQQATIDENGVAAVVIRGLKPGAYAFVAYLDENGDGRLNRGGVLGRPKEPIAFSNGVRPKLRRPRFDEAAVEVAPGAVVVMALDD